MASILTELKRRNVFKATFAYIAVGWLIISIGDILFPLLEAPSWVFKLLLLLVALGLPVVMVFAWIFEFTSQGIKLENEIDRSETAHAQSNRKANYVVIASLVAVLSVSIYLNLVSRESIEIITSGPQLEPSIAVLPFDDRSTDPENALFADGIHDDLLTNLAHIGALKVISRTSVMQYRNTSKKIRQIAEELGVATILEGAVQRSGNQVRINVQLIDAITDDHLWASRYDRELTTKNIFEIQSEIAKSISSALKATLTKTEQSRLEAVPTESMGAYNLYRAGRRNLEERQLETMRLARTQFEQAIALDPNYSEAYSGLADSILLLWINHKAIPGNEAYTLTQDALDQALLLDPNNADAYASLGLLKLDIWLQTRSGPELEEAEMAFSKALELNPNHARAVMWYAGLKSSQFKLDEAIHLFKRSLELDPLGRIPYANLPGLYAAKGQNQQALDKWLEAVRLHPGWPTPYQNIAKHMNGLGRFDESIAWGTKAAELDTDPLTDASGIIASLALGDFEQAIKQFDAIPEDHPFYQLSRVYILVINNQYEALTDALENSASLYIDLPPFALDMISDSALMNDDLDTALKYLLKSQPNFNDNPLDQIDRENVVNAIKLAYIKQLNGDEAYATQLLDASLAALESQPRLGYAGYGIRDVQIFAIKGDSQEALARLRTAIDAGFRSAYVFNNWSLIADPYLASIRNSAEFQAMHEELEGYIAKMRERAEQAEASGNWEPLLSLAATNPVNPAANSL